MCLFILCCIKLAKFYRGLYSRTRGCLPSCQESAWRATKGAGHMQWVEKTVEVQREPCAAGLKPHPCGLGNIKSVCGGGEGEEVKAAP